MVQSPFLKAVQRHSRITARTRPPAPAALGTGMLVKQQATPGEFDITQPAPVKAAWVPTPLSVGAAADAARPLTPLAMEPGAPLPDFPEKPPGLSAAPLKILPEQSETGRIEARLSQPASTEDSLWRRLQTIFNRHEDKEQQEKGSETSVQTEGEGRSEANQLESQQPVPPAKPASPDSGPIQRKEAATEQGGLADLQATQPPSRIATPHPEEIALPQPEAQLDDSSLTAIPLQTEKQSSSGEIEQMHPRMVVKPVSESHKDQQASKPVIKENRSQESTSSDDATLPEQKISSAKEDEIQLSEASSESLAPKSQKSPPIAAGETISSLIQPESSIEVHPTPLQSVWPVQETAAQPEINPAATPGSQPQPGTHTKTESAFSLPKNGLQSELPDEPGFRQIQSSLEGAPTAPSDSSIEFIPPRRPRPLPRPTEPTILASKVQRQADHPSSKSALAPAAEKSELPQTAAIVQKSRTTLVVDPADQKPVLSSEPVTAPRERPSPIEAESGGPALVTTEIGDLPADLWQLIGEIPPADSALAPAENQSASPQRLPNPPGSAAQVMRSPASQSPVQAESQPPMEKVLHRQANVLPRQEQVIQRLDDQPARTAPIEQMGESQPEEGQATQAAQEVDIQELAKKVYSEIKTKLALEWERRRS